MGNPQQNIPSSVFGDSEQRGGFAAGEQESHSNRSSASFFINSRPSSLEIAIREAFKNTNSESDVNPKFMQSVDQYEKESPCDYMLCGFVIEEGTEHCELPADDESKP